MLFCPRISWQGDHLHIEFLVGFPWVKQTLSPNLLFLFPFTSLEFAFRGGGPVRIGFWRIFATLVVAGSTG